MDDQPMLVKHHAYSRHGLLLSLCCALGCSMLWRAELAGCAQRDSAKPVKQSGVREGQRWGRSPFHVLYPCLSPGFLYPSRVTSTAESHQVSARREAALLCRHPPWRTSGQCSASVNLGWHMPDRSPALMLVIIPSIDPCIPPDSHNFHSPEKFSFEKRKKID